MATGARIDRGDKVQSLFHSAIGKMIHLIWHSITDLVDITISMGHLSEAEVGMRYSVNPSIYIYILYIYITDFEICFFLLFFFFFFVGVM